MIKNFVFCVNYCYKLLKNIFLDSFTTNSPNSSS